MTSYHSFVHTTPPSSFCGGGEPFNPKPCIFGRFAWISVTGVYNNSYNSTRQSWRECYSYIILSLLFFKRHPLVTAAKPTRTCFPFSSSRVWMLHSKRFNSPAFSRSSRHLARWWHKSTFSSHALINHIPNGNAVFHRCWTFQSSRPSS